MARLSMEQLKHRTWKSREALVKELKRNGFPERGEDYEPGETSPGSGMWHLVERGEAEAFGAHVVGGNAGGAKRKQGPKPSRETATRRTAKAAAVEDEVKAEPDAPPQQETDDKVTDWVVNNTVEHKSDPAASPPTLDLLAPLPHNGKPYRLVLVEGEDFTAHTAHTTAREIARAACVTSVRVHDKDSRLVGVFVLKGNGTTAKPAKAERKQRAVKEGEGPSELMAKVIKLATRKQGVTRKEIAEQVSDRKLAWTIMIKSCERFGYRYWQTEAKEGSGARTVYHLEKTT